MQGYTAASSCNSLAAHLARRGGVEWDHLHVVERLLYCGHGNKGAVARGRDQGLDMGVQGDGVKLDSARGESILRYMRAAHGDPFVMHTACSSRAISWPSRKGPRGACSSSQRQDLLCGVHCDVGGALTHSWWESREQLKCPARSGLVWGRDATKRAAHQQRQP
jgi:hypothetical protein